MAKKIIKNDESLSKYSDLIELRINKTKEKEKELLTNADSLFDFATGYLYYGLHKYHDKWVFREWAPNATQIFLTGDFSNWEIKDEFELKLIKNGNWEIELPLDKIRHGELFQLLVKWKGGEALRLPAWGKRVVQDNYTKIYTAQVWYPRKEYKWKIKNFTPQFKHPLIYEAHIGMSTEEQSVGTYIEFKDQVLPRIIKSGYNTLQLMAIQEHPYYGSFGYHVSNFFAPSSRFGTPEELKELIDEAHRNGIAVIMDIVHSHAVKNEMEGLGNFAGSRSQYFHSGERGEHPAWDSYCFDYGKNEVLHFLLSNCKYWLHEFKFDGFRFDGVTSMLYYDHALNRSFTSYKSYFDGQQDEDAITYLSLANKLIHQINKNAISIAEEMSGMPKLTHAVEDGGMNFDYRLAMGIPDYWIKLIKEQKDEDWNVNNIFYELNNRRKDEKTVSYAESHDQALVGDKTIIFRLIDKDMYWHMDKKSSNMLVNRGIALHKMIRLITLSTAGGAYLNFMGNEFGHPEWIDFPREGNDWSYQHARRQWSLSDNPFLRYHYLNDFDRDMINLIKKQKIFDDEWCYKLHGNESDQVLAYIRGNLLFVFNFNPTKSYTDYRILVEKAKYKIVLNSDSESYGGFGLVDESLIYHTKQEPEGNKPHDFGLYLYIPARTCMVLKKS